VIADLLQMFVDPVFFALLNAPVMLSTTARVLASQAEAIVRK